MTLSNSYLWILSNYVTQAHPSSSQSIQLILKGDSGTRDMLCFEHFLALHASSPHSWGSKEVCGRPLPALLETYSATGYLWMKHLLAFDILVPLGNQRNILHLIHCFTPHQGWCSSLRSIGPLSSSCLVPFLPF